MLESAEHHGGQPLGLDTLATSSRCSPGPSVRGVCGWELVLGLRAEAVGAP